MWEELQIKMDKLSKTGLKTRKLLFSRSSSYYRPPQNSWKQVHLDETQI